MKLHVGDTLHGFTVATDEALPEIEGRAYTLRHERSGARLLYLANDDANKAFSIAFKTPPADDTGVFHILEHSVLCGSDRFPVKEPFVNLLKGSMQTFLNAMTFPDKTMYPVASTNEQDLENLMDVYLDAVLHPAIYAKRTIFEQEGWHYELAGCATASDGAEADCEQAGEAAEGEGGHVDGAEACADGACGTADDAPASALAINGVVYNEMKGALSDAESVLYDTLSAALFPDTAYRFESGGTPTAIPDLTYEAFLDAHARHYNLANSYLTLYGDLDAERFLAFLDERYLAPCADLRRDAAAPNPLGAQAPLRSFGNVKRMATAPENACAAVGYVAGTARDRERLIGVDILLDAVMGSNESPMKRALLDAGLADDAQAYLADAVLQPFVVVQLRGTQPGAAARLREVVEECARDLAAGGLDRELVEASLSHAEFVMRERNFGMSDGVALAMSSLAGWLYDDEMATDYLRYEDSFASLREKIDEGWFEQLCRELFLENPHAADAEVLPVERDEEAAAALAARLSAAEAALGAEGLARIERQVDELRAAQERPDAPEELATLPRLHASDIGDAPAEPPYRLDEAQPVRTLRHDVNARGIVYAYRYFDLARLAYEEIPYATVLAMVLGKLNTARHTARELDTLAQSTLGNLSFFAEVHENVHDRDRTLPLFCVSASALSENVEAAAQLPVEVMTETDFGDHDRILDVLRQKKTAMEQGFAGAGHTAAMARVASYYLPAAVIRESLGGVDFYRFLKELVDDFDARADDLTARLADIAGRLFTDDGCTLSFTGTDDELARFWAAGGATGRTASADEAAVRLRAPEPHPRNEAFVVPSDVTYSAVGYDRRLLGLEHDGAWLLASRILSFDYLWNEVRVKGGAYGTGFQTTRSGNLRFYSFRDPRIDETLARFGAAGEWLADLALDEAEFEGYLVSTVAGIDAPCKPRELARRQDGQFFADSSPAARLATREQVRTASMDAVRALGGAVGRVAAAKCVCTFGNRDVIEGAVSPFDVHDLLAE